MAEKNYLKTAKPYRNWIWYTPLWCICFLVFLPLVFLLHAWLSIDTEIWIHLWQTQMLGLLWNTLLLVVGVGVGVSILGVGLAWLTAVCHFPGRKFFDWALILPLAVPAYVLAFVVLGVFDFGGSAQLLLRALGATGYLDIRGPFAVICVMTLVLYPYVYLLARSAFLSQGTELIDVSRTLGIKPISAFFRVAIPAARPAIVAGVSLALMETLADFGAVSIFGYDTFTTAIYKSWLSFFSLETAAQLASLLLLLVILTLVAERRFRPASSDAESIQREQSRFHLQGAYAWLAVLVCSLLLLVAVILPLVQLMFWAFDNLSYVTSPDFQRLIVRTATLGAGAAVAVSLIALPCVFAARRGKLKLLPEFAGLGYALPGSVLAVGIMFVLAAGDQAWVWLGSLSGIGLSSDIGEGSGSSRFHPFLLGSLGGMLLAYVIRFFRPGYGALASSVGRIRHSFLESGALMGVSRVQVFFRVSLPLLMPGLLTGLLIVFVDVIKEMPASLLLRPFGWDTLAIKIYELTSEGEWQRAALPALILVLVSLAPVVLLIRQSREQNGARIVARQRKQGQVKITPKEISI